MTDFSLWDRQNLIDIATDMHKRLKEQSEEIEALKADLKAAIEAYRAVNTKENV